MDFINLFLTDFNNTLRPQSRARDVKRVIGPSSVRRG